MFFNEDNIYSYLVSTSHSGSTLLSILLDTHPEISSIGEVSNSIGSILRNNNELDKYICSCGKEIKDCSFWQNVKKQCANYGVDLNLHNFETRLELRFGKNIDRVLFGSAGKLLSFQYFLDHLLSVTLPSYRKTTDKFVYRSSVIAKSVIDVTGTSVFFDASKEVGYGRLLIKDNSKIKIIHLVRDPRGVVNSYLKHGKYDSYEGAVKSYRRTHWAALKLKNRLPANNYLALRYEDLCRYPSEVLEGIFNFIDVKPMKIIDNVNDKEHHIIGNNMRLGCFKGIQIDESWREQLPSKKASRCLRLADGIANKFNYI